MSLSLITIINPPPPPVATPVFRIVNGQRVPEGVSINWTARTRPPGITDGCPSWMESIAVAGSFDAASKHPKLTQMACVVSSSFSSRFVAVIHLDANGNTAGTETLPFVFVPKFHQGPDDPHPIADEIWFATEPFATVRAQVNDPTVQDVETGCAQGVLR